MMLISREIVIYIFPAAMNFVGIYLYLMAVNGLTLIQATSREGPRGFVPVAARTIVEIAAFAGLMLIISFVREYFGNGTLWGVPMPIPFRQPGILYPFFGFIFTGFLLAFLRRVNKLMLAVRIGEAQRVQSVYE
jgi:electron transport complex protein RnfE